MTINVALAGAGAFGIKHLDAIKAIDGVKVVSLMSRDRAKTEEVARKYGIPHATTDLAESLALKEVDAGRKVEDVTRKLGITATTFYRWKAKFAGMNVSDAKRLRQLEEENRRLKQLLADTMLDNQALKGLPAKNG